MAKISGGHAIMLAVEIPSAIRTIAEEWVAAKAGRTLSEDHHLTLLFCGRDLDERHAEQVRLAGQWAATVAQDKVLVANGQLAPFGYHKDHVALRLMISPWMQQVRQTALLQLSNAGLEIKPDWDFNPHITLAKGEKKAEMPPDEIAAKVLRAPAIRVKLGTGSNVFHDFSIASEGL